MEKKKEEAQKPKTLHRVEQGKVVAGVAMGIARYLSVDPTVIRLLFVLAAMFGGGGVVAYLILMVLMPSSKVKVESEVGVTKKNDDGKMWGGIIVIMIGVYFLMRNFGFLGGLDMAVFWPVIVIAVGLSILLKK